MIVIDQDGDYWTVRDDGVWLWSTGLCEWIKDPERTAGSLEAEFGTLQQVTVDSWIVKEINRTGCTVSVAVLDTRGKTRTYVDEVLLAGDNDLRILRMPKLPEVPK